jgi:formate--tetrahydrofolate ligase
VTASSLEIARSARLRPIVDVAADAGLAPEELQPYGSDVAKVPLDALERRRELDDGRLVVVTSMTPTPHGEGKTTTATALADGLAAIGRRALLCVREPSLGPVFGLKGGGAGGGRAQVAPMERINLHFTGDLHAISAANNLLAALVDASLHHGNPLRIEPHSVTWMRCLDVNDRALRAIVTGLGGKANGLPRETGFDITAASEVMAVLAVASDLEDLRTRLGAITVAHDVAGAPVTAEALGAAGSMAVLLKDAISPNLVQTLEGNPAFVHCGPFANIAHGTNSLVADLMALKLADYVVTEAGFGSDMGLEKFVDIVCRRSGMTPSVAVVVATVRALEHHGEANLARHVEIVRGFGLEPVVALNRFAGDTDADVDRACDAARRAGARAVAACDAFARGGEGAEDLAAAVVASARTAELRFTYELAAPLEEKLDAVARRVYGGDGVELSPTARRALERIRRDGLEHLPVCVAKTPLSLSHDPSLAGAPTGFVLPIRDLRAYTGAGWIVAAAGDVMTMPGLGREPAAQRIDLDPDGRIAGLA